MLASVELQKMILAYDRMEYVFNEILLTYPAVPNTRNNGCEVLVLLLQLSNVDKILTENEIIREAIHTSIYNEKKPS